jgi:hypothetical protein
MMKISYKKVVSDNEKMAKAYEVIIASDAKIVEKKVASELLV